MAVTQSTINCRDYSILQIKISMNMRQRNWPVKPTKTKKYMKKTKRKKEENKKIQYIQLHQT